MCLSFFLLRAGRTGRLGASNHISRRKGVVISLVTKRDRVLATAIQRSIETGSHSLADLSSDRKDYQEGGRFFFLSQAGMYGFSSDSLSLYLSLSLWLSSLFSPERRIGRSEKRQSKYSLFLPCSERRGIPPFFISRFLFFSFFFFFSLIKSLSCWRRQSLPTRGLNTVVCRGVWKASSVKNFLLGVRITRQPTC